MNSFNLQSNHRVAVPASWLPKPATPKPPTPPPQPKQEEPADEEPDDGDGDGAGGGHGKVKGKSTMSRSKQKAFERMLAEIERQEEHDKHMREKEMNASAEAAKAKKEAEAAKRLKVIEDRERRATQAQERRLAKEGAALAKRRTQDQRMAAYREAKEKAVVDALAAKTRHHYTVKGNSRPDGRLARAKVKELNYMYFGDYASHGEEKTRELKKKWGAFADPDLYFWVPHGYGEWRNHSAEEPFMEGEMVSGVMQGVGTYRFGADEGDRTYKGLFQNDRQQGFGVDSRPTGDPEHPISHRLAVYQRGKQICYLDELMPGTRIKLYGQEHFDFTTDARNAGTGAKPSQLPVMPHARAPARSCVILEACGGAGVFRVKPDFAQSLVVNLSSTLWDLEKPSQPLFQGLELYTGETDEERFTYDHHKVYHTISDGRENFFGPSSRIKLAGNAVAEKQQAAAAKYALHKEEEAAKVKAEEEKEKEANDRKEARRMAKAEKKRAAAEAAAEEADRAALGADYAKMLEVRENALAKSQVVNDDDDANSEDNGELFVINEKNGKRELKPLRPLLPNSGRLIFDDQRWTFIPNGRSLKGPPKVKKKKDSKASKLASKVKAKRASK